ncbi:MAG TPA: hypothetical protein VF066_02350 [Thermoleophilaceae bacterium]
MSRPTRENVLAKAGPRAQSGSMSSQPGSRLRMIVAAARQPAINQAARVAGHPWAARRW